MIYSKEQVIYYKSNVKSEKNTAANQFQHIFPFYYYLQILIVKSNLNFQMTAHTFQIYAFGNNNNLKIFLPYMTLNILILNIILHKLIVLSKYI